MARRIALSGSYDPPATGTWRLVGDYDPRSANYMRWYWESTEQPQLELVI